MSDSFEQTIKKVETVVGQSFLAGGSTAFLFALTPKGLIELQLEDPIGYLDMKGFPFTEFLCETLARLDASAYFVASQSQIAIGHLPADQVPLDDIDDALLIFAQQRNGQKACYSAAVRHDADKIRLSNWREEKAVLTDWSVSW